MESFLVLETRLYALAGIDRGFHRAGIRPGNAVVSPEPEVHKTALMVHLAAMVVSFSGVLAVDIRGFLWMAGVRPVQAALRMESFVTPFIWGGLLALMVSGIFLEPSLDALPTLAKLAAVLGLILNGIWLVPSSRPRAISPPLDECMLRPCFGL